MCRGMHVWRGSTVRVEEAEPEESPLLLWTRKPKHPHMAPLGRPGTDDSLPGKSDQISWVPVGGVFKDGKIRRRLQDSKFSNTVVVATGSS